MNNSAIVSTSSFLALCTVCFFTLIVPIFLVIFLAVKKKIIIKPFFIGALAWFVSQVVLRIPIMQILGTNTKWFPAFTSTIVGVIIIGGLTAGLFEESARLFGAKLFLKNKTFYKDAISFGLGHGLCEVIVIVGLGSISNILNASLINSGLFNTVVAAQNAPAEAVDLVIKALTTYNYGTAGIVILERIIAVAFHIFATVLIFKGINEKKITYYFIAILAHTAFNSIAVLTNKYFGAVVCELILLGITIFVSIYTVKVKGSFPCVEQNATTDTNNTEIFTEELKHTDD